MEAENSIIELKGTNQTIFYFHLLAFQPAENKQFICSNIPGVCFLPIYKLDPFTGLRATDNVFSFLMYIYSELFGLCVQIELN